MPASAPRRRSKVKFAGHLLHVGILLALLGLEMRHFASPEPRDISMAPGDTVTIDVSRAIYLEKFDIPTWPSGKPRQFVSRVHVYEQGRATERVADVSVNHPLRLGDAVLYQYSYGPDQTGTACTVLRYVKDAGLPLAANGGLCLILGALLLAWRRCRAGTDAVRRDLPRWMRYASWGVALAAVAVPAWIMTRAVLRPEPMPALQSWLMAPHVAAYAASYLILLFAACGIGRRWVSLGFLLMTLGLVLGAVWGKLAWSEWWQFDPKENWSFVTWLAFAAYFHLRPDSRAAAWCLRLGGALILITLTWVNFSKIFTGIHSYA